MTCVPVPQDNGVALAVMNGMPLLMIFFPLLIVIKFKETGLLT